MSLLKVTLFPQLTLPKMMILRIARDLARDFYQQHGIEMWNLSYLSIKAAIYCSSYVASSRHSALL